MLLAALGAAGAASLGLLACLLVVVLGWSTEPNSTGTPATLLRAAGQLWVLAHRGPVQVDGSSVVIAPLGLTALCAFFAARASRASIRRTGAVKIRAVAGAALGVAPAYALLVGLVARVSGTSTVRPIPLPALATAGGIAAAAGLFAAARAAGWKSAAAWLPAGMRAALAGAAVFVAGLVGLGAVLTAGSLSVDHRTANDVAESVDASAPSGLVLVLVQATLTPNAAIWGGSYAAGTGFDLGAGTVIAPDGAVVGAAPAVPLLAALPGAGPAPIAVRVLCIAGVLAAAAVGGTVFGRRLDAADQHLAGPWFVAAAVISAAGFALLCWLAGGAGPGRLSLLGPSPVQVAVACAQWAALGGVPAAWVVSWRAARRERSALPISAD